MAGREPKMRMVVGAFVLFVLGASCAPPPEPPAGWTQWFLTRDGADVTTLTVAGQASENIEVVAPVQNTGTNSRTVFTATDNAHSTDQMSCATITHGGRMTQEGVALRMRTDGERHRSVTVTKNIWGGSMNIYNVHLWDSNFGGPLGAVLISSFDMAAQLDGYGPDDGSGRRICAQVLDDVLSFKVWWPEDPEPSWSDESYVRTVRIPREWVFSGQAGYYIGHLFPGGRATFTDMVESVFDS